MDINVNTIIKINFSLDEAEARELLVDPAPFQAEIRRHLAAAHGGGGGNGGSRNGKVAPGPKVARGRKPRANTLPTKQPCPKCGRRYLAKRLAIHIAKKHPEMPKRLASYIVKTEPERAPAEIG